MRLRRVRLDEVKELEPIVMKDLEGIEEGLCVLDNQLSVGRHGRPDILAVDSDHSLVIIELKSVSADVDALAQTLRYYDWFSSNVALAARPFPKVNPQNPVRIFIVAPDFTDDLQRMCTYMDIDISLIRVFSVRNELSGEAGVIFEHIESERRDDKLLALRSTQDIINYVSDISVRDEFCKVLKFLDQRDVLVAPYQGGKWLWLECRFKGDEIAYLQPRRRYFRCQYYDEKKEDYVHPPVKCSTFDEWKAICYPRIEPWMEEEG